VHPFFRFLLLFAGFLFCLTACGPDDIYLEKKEIQGAWSYSDALDFEFEVVDTSLMYNMYLLADFDAAYRNQNLYFKIKTEFPNGKRDSVIRSIDFFDVQGKPLADCSAEDCSLRAYLQENAFFNLQGTYRVRIAQHSRDPQLSTIKAIGLEVEKGAKRAVTSGN